MAGPIDDVRTRVLPALLTAFGVTILSAGLLTYTVPVGAAPANPASSPEPSVAVVATPTPLITLPPLATRSPAIPTPSPTPPSDRVATRIRISGLGIDLPVVRGNDGYPYCNVAMYLPAMSQPGFGRATYLYAHAREGMFLPLLRTKAFEQRGKIVDVFTSDDRLFQYEITEVRRDQTFEEGLVDPQAATSEQLWLQTSQGPNRSYGYTQVIAKPIGSKKASHASAHPRPRPVVCG
jgi:hypothetical protein